MYTYFVSLESIGEDGASSCGNMFPEINEKINKDNIRQTIRKIEEGYMKMVFDEHGVRLRSASVINFKLVD